MVAVRGAGGVASSGGEEAGGLTAPLPPPWAPPLAPGEPALGVVTSLAPTNKTAILVTNVLSITRANPRIH